MPKTLSERAGGQPARTTPDAIHGMIGGVSAALQVWGAPGEYMLDAIQRTILFRDVQRQHSAPYYAQKAKALPLAPTAVAPPYDESSLRGTVEAAALVAQSRRENAGKAVTR